MKESIKNKRIENYYRNPKYCKHCNKIIPYSKRHTNEFCSHSCAATYNNLGRILYKPNPIKNCRRCNKKLSRRNTDICFKCFNIEKMEERIKNGGYIKSSALRKYYIAIRGHKCEECKNTLWNGNLIPLNAHHIDGDTYNNKPENIKILCPNCHAQTPNYCSKNRGNGKFKIIRIPKRDR